MHIGLDLDGTLADHTRAKLMLAEELGVALQPKQTASEVLEHLFPKEEYRALQQKLYGELSDTAEPVPFARETLKALIESGHDLSIISRRKGDGRERAKTWLARHYHGLIPHDKIFFVETDREKDAACKDLGIAVFVDDQLGVLACLDSVAQRFLFDPYKNFAVVPRGIEPLVDWRDLPAKMQRGHKDQERPIAS